MALIKCKECKEEVSSKAKTCPKCGAEVAKKSIGCGGLIGYFIVGAIAISWLSSLFSTNTKNITSPQISSAASTASIPPTPALPGSQWSYLTSDDKMGKGTIHHAFLSSSNSVNFEFPYAGIQHGTLSLRINPRYGKDIIFKIEKDKSFAHLMTTVLF